MNAPTNIAYNPATFDWWKAALKGERGQIHDGEPMQGFYRSRVKNKQTGEVTAIRAVAYWWKDGKCFCQIDGEILQGDQLERWIGYWPYVSREPISHETWKIVVKEGKPWPDQHVIEKAAPADTASTPPGGEKPPEATGAGAADQRELTPQGKLKVEIETAIKGISRYVKVGPDGKSVVSQIDSDDMAGAAQSLRDMLNKLSTKAKKAREDANRPHQDAIKANGLIWTPLETLAKNSADGLRDGPIKAWEVHKREQAAAAAKAAQAAAASSAPNTTPPQIASNAPAPSATIKGATGRAASVSTVKIAVIHDLEKVFQHFKDSEQVRAVLQGLSNAAVRAGISVPGVTVTEDVSIK